MRFVVSFMATLVETIQGMLDLVDPAGLNRKAGNVTGVVHDLQTCVQVDRVDIALIGHQSE